MLILMVSLKLFLHLYMQYNWGAKMDYDIDMAQIPYIEHEYRMYKAYIREKKLKVWLVITNCLWMVGAIITAIVR